MEPSTHRDTHEFDYRRILGTERKGGIRFSEFVDHFIETPDSVLKTSASVILEAIKHFGIKAIVRSGEPCLRYKLFQDPFSNGTTAVYGQESCIKRIVDVIESVDKESGSKRGIVLVGPPASGKTNIADLIARALEEYSKEARLKQFSFYFRLESEEGRELELRSSLMPNPILLFPITLQNADGSVSRPRQEILDHVSALHKDRDGFTIPSFYRYATLDKQSQDILESLRQNPRNRGKTFFDIVEEYIRIEEVEYSVSRGKGIANVDDMRHLKIEARPLHIDHTDTRLLADHLRGRSMYRYEGALLSCNRGLLHVHDAFGGDGSLPDESEYKPLLMLLGSGKIAMEYTQASLDTTVLMTTNLEEMQRLDQQLTSSKLLDRIEKIPVNYLLDALAEKDILRRDIANVRDRYDIDPNLARVAAYYGVLTRLFPPNRRRFPKSWSEEKRDLYRSITPEQKLFIYAAQSEDPVHTIRKLPPWHPFRNECLRLGLDLEDEPFIQEFVVRHPGAISLEDSGLFNSDELQLIDDEFMRELGAERYPDEGRYGLSIRQLQNIMRNTIAVSDGRKVTVSIFLSQLEQVMKEGPDVHHWLTLDAPNRQSAECPPREIGNVFLEEGEGEYGDYEGLIKVVQGLYHFTLRKEITMATVDRDPMSIEFDLRKYLQHALLDRARENTAFAHVIVPRYTYLDPDTGSKVDKPDYQFMEPIAAIIKPEADPMACHKEMARKFLDLHGAGEITSDPTKPLIYSKNDNLLNCFSSEYTSLLSNRRSIEGINPEELRDGFFQRQNQPSKYQKLPGSVRDRVETILRNLVDRFDYPEDIALDAVVYALRKEIIDFKDVLS